MLLRQLLRRAVTGPGSAAVAKQALPGAALSAGVGLLTGGPVDALAYGAGDFLFNYPALRAARKYFPGKEQIIKDVVTGATTKSYSPSMAENIINVGASLGSGALVSTVLTPQATSVQPDAQQFLAQQAQQLIPQVESQRAQNAQQMIQRSSINRLPLDRLSVSPNTMYQTQGIEQTMAHYPGITLPPEIQKQIQEYVAL